MDVAEIANESETPLKRWTADEFIELLNEGLIENPRRVEVIDGLMVNEMPQGDEHDFIYRALLLAFAAMGAYPQGLVPTCTLVLGPRSVVEPEFSLLRKSVIGRYGLPHREDVLWVVEVSVTSRRKDLTDKRDAYAVAGIPEYWVFDAKRRGVWVFKEPVGGAYTQEAFFAEGAKLKVPVLGTVLETSGVFPPVSSLMD